jgi:alpha-glucosidase
MNPNNLRWWQRGIIYQIYPRSFKDSNGDGIGDLQGIIEQLDHLRWLGIDAIWISPFYPSPMVDFGYDVSDYCDVHPLFGDLATFDRLIAGAHKRDIKVIIDYVPNHTSNQHPWFLESRTSRDNPKRNWYIWRDPKPDGSLPNNWGSNFGGVAWEWDERTKQYYYHQFCVEQPDLNWRNPDVRVAMMDVLRFWLARGVDGFRMDVVGMILKDPAMRDQPLDPNAPQALPPNDIYHRQLHIYDQDQDEVHTLMREFRALLDEHGDHVGIGEVWSPLPSWIKYFGERGDGLHLPFNFRLVRLPWDARTVRQSIDDLEAAIPLFGWPDYVLGNHDVPRLASRLGAAQARVAAMLLLTLRGTPTLYQGDEIGTQNGDIPREKMQDPWGRQLGPARNRDVARTPMQWNAGAFAGFSTTEPWLPVSADYSTRNVAVQAAQLTSILNLYRELIRLRCSSPALFGGSYRAVEDVSDGCFVYWREHAGERYLIALNFTDAPRSVSLPARAGSLVLSTHLDRAGPVRVERLELRADEGVIIKQE